MTQAVVVCSTPFRADGSFDPALVESHLRRVMAHVDTVLVGGSGTEEGFALSADERRELVTLAVRLGGELSVQVRLNAREPRTVQEAQSDLALATELGCSAVHLPILDVGHGYRTTERDLRGYLDAALGDGGDLPIYISSSQVMGHVFPIGVLDAVASAHPRVKGMVVGAPTDVYLLQVLRTFEGRWDVYIAGTGQLLNGLASGAAGFISPEGNVAPQACRALVAALDAGDWPAVAAAASLLQNITATIAPYGLTGGMKMALRHLGLLDSYLRAPRTEPDQAAVETVGTRVAELLARWDATKR